MRPLAFVDLETTGATATRDRITEIGIVEVDTDGRVREWQQLINPGTRIPPFIEQLTGISNRMVATAPSFAEVADETLRRLAGRLFIAHNARFDYGFLKNEFKRLGIAFRAPVLCTVKLSRSLYPEYPRHSLDALIERHRLTADARHRALADAQLIHQFWQKIQVDRSKADLDSALNQQNACPSLPQQLDPGILDELPDGPGVYIFYGENSLPLYIGKAKDLRQRVLSHFSSDHQSAKEMALSQQLRRIDWIETAGEIGALLKEAALVKQLQPAHNRQLKKHDTLCTWILRDEGDGWLRPELVQPDEIDMGMQAACYGLFKNRKEAIDTLRTLAGELGLCEAMLGLEKHQPGKPCFALQLKRCKGACVGHESTARHSMRLLGGLVRLKLMTWPFPGAAIIREDDDVHLLKNWRHLGTAHSENELFELLAKSNPPFDRDIYKILGKQVGKLKPFQ